MAMRGLEGEDLKKGLRELMISWETIIREAGSFEQAEDTLLHLEENDENFHKYDFIKALKQKLEETLSNVIDDELEKHSTRGHIDSGSHETVVSEVTEHIIKSKQYGDLKKKLGRNISEAVDSLIANFDSEFAVGHVTNYSGFYDPSKTPLVTDDEEGSVMLFNQDYLKNIADNLGKTKNAVTRREAMQKLNHIVSGEIVQNKFWPQLRRNLLDVMADTDDQLSDLSLKFVAKSFTCTSHHTSQVYILLMEFLCGQFSPKIFNLPPPQNGLNCTDKNVIRMLKAFRLMIEFQQDAPNYWVRYPLVYLEEVVESSLNLLTLHLTSQAPLTKLSPLHFIAVLDPKAQWFIKWMHGNYCRRELLDRLQQYKVLVEVALRQCLEFSASRKTQPDEVNEVSELLTTVSFTENGKRLYYTHSEIEYALFIHSLSFLGRLIYYANGRAFFPVKLKDKQVNINQLLRALVLLIVDPGQTSSHTRTDKSTYEYMGLVTEVFKFLCSTETTCGILMCKDDIMGTLLSPVTYFLDDTLDGPLPAEETLLHVADILCVLASTAKGRQYLLYGQGKTVLTRIKSSLAHLIAEFTRRALSNNLSKTSILPSKSVIGAYVYVCRQLYTSCDGLLVLSQYELHNCLAQTWKQLQISDKTGSSTTSLKGDDADKYKDAFMDSWKEMLQDNLLNFASTAKGILLLHQTGAFNECVRYMYSRYDKKLQVSKCEKFGYGCMVTQVAATAPGIRALHNTGYIKALLLEIWSSLECGPQDTPIYTPKTWPVDPIDRHSQKHFVRLANILSAFPAVYEIIHGEPLPARKTYSLRDIPDSIMALIDRIIIVDSDMKIHSLFNYEQSYTFGLRLLSVMVSCLDTYLLLQSQYKIQEFLLKEQESSKTEDSEKFIIDMLSVERNYILVKTFMVGGPSERSLPLRTLEEDKFGGFRAPSLFSTYPIPREYQPNVVGRSSIKQESEITKFLNSYRGEKKPKVWMEKCRDALYKVMSTKPDQVKGNILQQLLEQVIVHQCEIQDEAIFRSPDSSDSEGATKNFKLSSLQALGVKTAIRYGIHLKVINTSSESTEDLTHLMKQAGCFLKQQQQSVKTSLQFLEGNYPGFDWFVASTFLIFNGNGKRAWKFLHMFSALASSAYLWRARLHASQHLPVSSLSSGIPLLFSGTAHNIELLLQTELPLVTSAFKMSGYTPSQICQHWLTQCFWNYLDWLDIVHYIVVCVCLGIDYQVYVCVAIFKHLQESILSHVQTHDLVIFLKEEAISKFHIMNQIKFMKELELKYRKIVLLDMMKIVKP